MTLPWSARAVGGPGGGRAVAAATRSDPAPFPHQVAVRRAAGPEPPRAGDRPGPAAIGDGRPVRVVALGAVAAIAAFNLFWNLGNPDWFVDELLYVTTGRQYVDGTPAGPVGHPPLAMSLFGAGDHLFGPGLPGARIVPALVSVATGVVVFRFARAVGGFWTGTAAAALWFVVPRPAELGGVPLLVHRMDRYAMLDAPAGLFLLLGLLCGWRWIASRRGAWAVASGVGLGCAVASKLPAVTGLVAVAVAATIVLPRDRSSRRQLAAMAGVAVLVVLAAYLPFGRRAPEQVRFMVSSQSAHAGDGHRIVVAGDVYEDAPWWTHLAYQWESDGPAVTLALSGGLVAAAVLVRRKVVVFLLLGGVVAPVVLLAASPVALPHYRALWMPAVTVLVAVGWGALLRAAAARRRPVAVGYRVAAALVAGPLLLAGVVDSVRLAGEPPGDYGRAGRVIASTGSVGDVVVAGHHPTAHAYLPRRTTVVTMPRPSRAVAAVVIDPIWSMRFPADGLVAFARDRGLRPRDVGRLQVWLPPR